MGKCMLIYDNAADEGTLSGGSWALPLVNMQDPRVTTIARSSNLDPTSTTWKVQLTEAKTLRAVVIGPTNLTSGNSYRIRAYSDPGYSNLVDDTGAITLGPLPQHTLDMHWTDAFWWSGAQPLSDPGGAAGGVWVIHVYDQDLTAQYWRFDLNNQSNPDGYIQIGRLFMGTAYIPSVNFSPNNNGFGFKSFTTIQQAASGTRYYNRRRSARTASITFPVLPQDEALNDIYKISAICGLDNQVFFIPDPDDTDRLSQRSFLGNLDELPTWQLMNGVVGGVSGIASSGFKITEAL